MGQGSLLPTEGVGGASGVVPAADAAGVHTLRGADRQVAADALVNLNFSFDPNYAESGIS